MKTPLSKLTKEEKINFFEHKIDHYEKRISEILNNKVSAKKLDHYLSMVKTYNDRITELNGKA